MLGWREGGHAAAIGGVYRSSQQTAMFARPAELAASRICERWIAPATLGDLGLTRATDAGGDAGRIWRTDIGGVGPLSSGNTRLEFFDSRGVAGTAIGRVAAVARAV